MISYQNMLIKLSSMLDADELPYKDTIIIGDNSCGKSDLLRKVLTDDEAQKYYFIDAVNRSFNIGQIAAESETNIYYSADIKKSRLEENNFNYKDTFYYGGTPRAIEDFYNNYSVELKGLMESFLNISFEIKQGKLGWEAFVNTEKVDLSSGYQALLRIFLECIYFSKTQETGTFVIDEIDEFLSVKNSGQIFAFLRRQFPENNFIVTTHSADLIANAENANLALLQGNDFEILDAGDFSSISQVYNIFDAIFERIGQKTEKERKDDLLRIFLNNKMAGVWDEDTNHRFEMLKMEKLTKTQKLIVKQIEEWTI